MSRFNAEFNRTFDQRKQLLVIHSALSHREIEQLLQFLGSFPKHDFVAVARKHYILEEDIDDVLQELAVLVRVGNRPEIAHSATGYEISALNRLPASLYIVLQDHFRFLFVLITKPFYQSMLLIKLNRL